MLRERDQKRDPGKNIYILKYFIVSQTKKDLKILLEQLHWLPLARWAGRNFCQDIRMLYVLDFPAPSAAESPLTYPHSLYGLGGQDNRRTLTS